MKARRITLIALAAGSIAGLLWWRRRGGTSVSQTSAQLGLADGSVHVLDSAGPAVAELESLSAAVRAVMTEQP